jgi:excisionase family DNA binding protein
MELQQKRTECAGLPQKSLLRPDEVAEFLSVSLKTIYRWHEMGVIEGTKLKKVLRIYRESVVKFVAENDTAA